MNSIQRIRQLLYHRVPIVETSENRSPRQLITVFDDQWTESIYLGRRPIVGPFITLIEMLDIEVVINSNLKGTDYQVKGDEEQKTYHFPDDHPMARIFARTAGIEQFKELRLPTMHSNQLVGESDFDLHTIQSPSDELCYHFLLPKLSSIERELMADGDYDSNKAPYR